MIDLAGGKPGAHVQGRSLVPLFQEAEFGPGGSPSSSSTTTRPPGRGSVGMTYKAVRTDTHKLIHWVHKRDVDELYDLAKDPYEMKNVIGSRAYAGVRKRLTVELRKLLAEASGL
jgi:arylsulfatase A-like enzyme